MLRLENAFFDQPAGAHEFQQACRFRRPGSFECVQRHGFDDAAVKCFFPPSVIGHPSGDERVPLLAQLEDSFVAPREEPFAISAANKDKREKQPIRQDSGNDGLEHKRGRAQPPKLFKNGSHSSIQNWCRSGFACVSGSRRILSGPAGL